MTEKDRQRLDSLKLGYYLQKGDIIKVVLTKNDKKIALRQNSKGFFNYEPGLVFKLFPNHEVSENVGT